MIRWWLKVSSVAVVVLSFWAIGLLLGRRKWRVVCLHYASRMVLFLLGIRRSDDGLPTATRGDGPVLIVANHLSYLDVLLISATLPCAFVTSTEVEKTPVEGGLARAGGSLFVDRRRRTTAAEQVSALQRVLQSGVSVVVFPEGTSGDGSALLPFKSTLLAAAVQQELAIQPLCLNYERVNGRVMDRRGAETVFYYGDHQFLPHLKGVLQLKSVQVRVEFLPRYSVSRGMDRRELTQSLFEKIGHRFVPVVAPSF